MKPFITAVILVAFLTIVLISGCVTEPPNGGIVHKHADFALYIDGQKFNFAQQKYMTDKNGAELSGIVHLHDMDGDIIHVHAPGVTLGMFFQSLGMKLETTTEESGVQHITFTDDEGHSYSYTRFGCYEYAPGKSICADPGPDSKTWRLFVNGQTIPESMRIEDYVIEDLDQILLTNAAFSDDYSSQLAGVTDKACIQSEKCPERGSPSDEDSCSGTGECGTGPIPTA